MSPVLKTVPVVLAVVLEEEEEEGEVGTALAPFPVWLRHSSRGGRLALPSSVVIATRQHFLARWPENQCVLVLSGVRASNVAQRRVRLHVKRHNTIQR